MVSLNGPGAVVDPPGGSCPAVVSIGVSVVVAYP